VKLFMVRFASLLLAILCVVPSGVAAKRSYPNLEWGLRVSAAAIYNDNLLRFSQADIEQFYDFNPNFATPLQTTDDFESEYGIRPSLRWRAPGNLMVDGYYVLKAVVRSENRFTDYQTHSLSASVRSREIGYAWVARYRVLRIPSYYLRVYRDRDYNEQHAARFANWDHQAQFDLRLGSDWWLELNGGFGTYYHNRKFTEYDSKYFEGGLGSRISLPSAISMNGSYIRRVSVNVGKDQAVTSVSGAITDPLVEDSEYGDSDFNEDDFVFRLRRPLSFIRFAVVDGSIAYRHRRRVYTTDRSLIMDPFHRGRLDNRFEISPSISIALNQATDIGIYFIHEERDTQSDNPAVIRAKEFVRREFGLTFAYTLH
jgi:hypothetical protein